MQPSTGVPSFSLYRGSLLALLVVTALAVWLLVQPSSSEGDNTAFLPVVTPTAAVAGGQATTAAGTPAPGTTTAVTGTPGTPVTTPGTQPAGTTTPRPTGTVQATPPLSGTPGTVSGAYTVVSGDTLSGICSAQRPSLSNTDCVASLRSLNNLSSDALSVGQSLRLP